MRCSQGAVLVGAPVNWAIDVVAEGRSTATAVVTARAERQTVHHGHGARRCALRRRHPPSSAASRRSPAPADAQRRRHADDRSAAAPRRRRRTSTAPTRSGRRNCTRGCTTTRCPTREDLAKALIAYFTGHLGISTTMRAHEGIGTARRTSTVSTAPMTVNGQLPRARALGRLAPLHPREHPGGCRHVLRARYGAHRGGRSARVVPPGRVDSPARTTDTAIKHQSRL